MVKDNKLHKSIDYNKLYSYYNKSVATIEDKASLVIASKSLFHKRIKGVISNNTFR